MPRIDHSALSATPARSDDAWWRPLTSGLATVQIDVDTSKSTLTELVRLAQLATTVPPQSPLLAAPLGLPCLPGAARVRLYFDDEAAQRGNSNTPHADMSAAAKRACDALAQILTNTRTEHQYHDTQAPAARVLNQYIRAIERSRRAQTAASFSHMVRITGEALHRHGSANLPPVRAQIAQTPTDCVLHWIAELDRARGTANPDDNWLMQTESAARRRWMQHDLTLPSVRAYLDQMHSECTVRGAADLADVVGKIQSTLPTDQQAAKFSTRLNDNLYGRVFETRLIAQLIAAPTPGTLICTQTLMNAIRDFVSELPPAVVAVVAKEVSLGLAAKPRFWFDRTPALRQFISAVPGAPKKQALIAWMGQPVQSSHDAMSVILLACQMSLVLKEHAADSAPWMWASDLNYAQVVQPSARRLNNMIEPLLRAEGGIALLHQRAMFSESSMRPGIRASLQHRPNLEAPSPATRRMLEHGLPYASGVSGSTNMLLYMAHFFKQGGTELDPKQLLLAAAMLLGAGHSLHEVLWVGHQLDHRLGLGLGLGTATPEAFISDYDRFIELFDGADHKALDNAVASAWDQTIAAARNATAN